MAIGNLEDTLKRFPFNLVTSLKHLNYTFTELQSYVKKAERLTGAGSELAKSCFVSKLGHATNVLQSYYQHNTRIINYKKAGMVMD